MRISLANVRMVRKLTKTNSKVNTDHNRIEGKSH